MILWAKITAALLGLIKPLMAFLIYLGGKRAGAAEARADAMRERQDNVSKAKRAKEQADSDDLPDPYIRD